MAAYENKRKYKRGFVPLSGMCFDAADPVLRKKAGLNMRLVRNWAEIAGHSVALIAVPLKIIWPRQAGTFKLPAGGAKNTAALRGENRRLPTGALLVISCSAYEALKLQHETSELIARINRFFGYQAIGKIRIEQNMTPIRYAAANSGANVRNWAKTPFGFANAAAAPPPALTAEVRADIAAIDNESLRASLQRLGDAVCKN